MGVGMQLRLLCLTPTAQVRSILSQIFPQQHVAFWALLASLLSSLNQATHHISPKGPKPCVPCRTLQGDGALKGVLRLMEFKEGNENLICCSIQTKSSREIQWCVLLCWWEVQKWKKSVHFSWTNQLMSFLEKNANLWICGNCICNSDCKKFRRFKCITANNFWTKGNKGNGEKLNFTGLLARCQWAVWPSDAPVSIGNDCKRSVVWCLLWALPACSEAGSEAGCAAVPWQGAMHACPPSCSSPSAGWQEGAHPRGHAASPQAGLSWPRSCVGRSEGLRLRSQI